MGLLSKGRPMTWDETRPHVNHIKDHGIIQFINVHKRLHDKGIVNDGDSLKWGDEIEGMIALFDDHAKRVRLVLKSEEMLQLLQKAEERVGLFVCEFAASAIETTPRKPYGGLVNHVNRVESSMRLRREAINKLLGPNECYLTMPVFPLLGCKDFTLPSYETLPSTNEYSQSLYISDEFIYNGHPRYRTLCQNIRSRRKSKVAVNQEIFRDKNTPDPFFMPGNEKVNDGKPSPDALPNHIYMDHMGFGMGCCCLQMTFQAFSLSEAKRLYDQLLVVTPLMLALTSASPIVHGYLQEHDCRWHLLEQACDDRTPGERGISSLEENEVVLKNSRYGPIELYISALGSYYNDVEVPINQKYFDILIEAGVDAALARHIAHIYLRDPVCVYEEKLHQDDENETDHFENINSTVWQNMRFKPPPPNSDIGWRIEFRPCDIQISDFENAAFAVFITILSRVILSYNLHFLIPISKLNDNFRRSVNRNAVTEERFYFCTNIVNTCCTDACKEIKERCENPSECDCEASIKLLTIDEIINGEKFEGGFIGLVPLLEQYVKSMEDIDVDTACSISNYLKLISYRASGKLMTWARWMRLFVQNHPAYKFDSVVNDEIAYDLVKRLTALSSGEVVDEDVLFKPLNTSKLDFRIS